MSIQFWTLRASSSYDNETDVFGEMIKPQEGDIRVVKKSDFDRAISLLKRAKETIETNSELTYNLSEKIEGKWGAALLGISEGLRCVLKELEEQC